MMKKIITSPYRKLKVLFIIPVFAIVFYAFATPEYHYAVTSGNSLMIIQAPVINIREVKGRVLKEDGTPFEGVQIVVTGSSVRVSSDATGNFAIENVPEDALLVFSFVGCKTQVVKALFAEEMTVKLLKDPDYKEPVEVRSDQPYVVVEQMPQYPGGEKELLKLIAQNTQYPVAAKAGNIEGKVIIRFVINTEGNTEDISVLKGVHPVLDAEAARVIGMLKGFVPGYQNGKAVDVYYKVPITFALRSRFPDVKQQPLVSSVEEPVADGIISTKDIIVVGFKDSPSVTGPLSIVNASDRSPANPLVIVDGREGDMKLLKTIDASNIESISVHKGESATNVYGEKGKNGVIIVKLKKGVSLQEP